MNQCWNEQQAYYPYTYACRLLLNQILNEHLKELLQSKNRKLAHAWSPRFLPLPHAKLSTQSVSSLPKTWKRTNDQSLEQNQEKRPCHCTGTKEQQINNLTLEDIPSIIKFIYQSFSANNHAASRTGTLDDITTTAGTTDSSDCVRSKISCHMFGKSV